LDLVARRWDNLLVADLFGIAVDSTPTPLTLLVTAIGIGALTYMASV
jgi:hypothetical protein